MRARDPVALRILKTLLSGESLSPKDLAIRLDVAPQTVRNKLITLTQVSLVISPTHGLYRVTELGREHYKNVSQPSTSPSSKIGET